MHDVPEYIAIMKESADKLIGIKYDKGQLINMALNNVFGNDFEYKIKLFDLGKERRVCSVGVRANFEYLRKELYRANKEVSMERLFNTLNRDYWTGREYEKFEQVDIEQTPPAIFVNSKYFDSEFKTVIKV